VLEFDPATTPDKSRHSWDLYTRRNRSVFLLILFAVGTSNYVDRNIIGVLLEGIKAEFHVSDTLLGLLTGMSFALFYVVFGIPVARWADRGNRRHVITISVLIWSFLTVLCGSAHTFWQLVAARFGVGAGEAGAIPPAQSLLADYYPPQDRARAIGVFMTSGAAGYAIGLVLGGFVAQNYGWRAAFEVVGCAGFALAPLTNFFLIEPRETSQPKRLTDNCESIYAAMHALFAKPAYRNVVMALVIYFLVAYGALVFIVSFMMRFHKLRVSQAGTIYGVVSTIGSLVGSVWGGALADRLARRDVAWLGRFAGVGLIVALPLYELTLSLSGILAMTVALLLATVLLTAVVPAMFSSLHLVCGSTRRALAVAIALFFANLIGLGFGPLIAGALSDRFGITYGPGDGLRYALMFVIPALLPAGLLMLRAAKYLRSDAED